MQLKESEKEYRFYLENQLTRNEQYLINDISPYNKTAWLFIKDALSLQLILMVIIILIAGDILTLEYHYGTISHFMIQPLTRTQLILIKYLSVVLISCVLIILMFILSVIVGASLFGFNNNSLYINSQWNGTLQKEIILSYISMLLTAIGIGTITFLISIITRARLFSTATGIFILFFSPVISVYCKKNTFMKWLLFCNCNLIESNNFFTTVLIFISNILLFILLAIFIFNKQEF